MTTKGLQALLLEVKSSQKQFFTAEINYGFELTKYDHVTFDAKKSLLLLSNNSGDDDSVELIKGKLEHIQQQGNDIFFDVKDDRRWVHLKLHGA